MMYADEFDQDPEQVTLTHQWFNTKRRGCDDEEIDRDSNEALVERKRSKQKPFVPRPPTNQVEDEEEVMVKDVELLDLTQTEILEAAMGDDASDPRSSNDSALKSKLISPLAKKKVHSTMDTPLPSNTK